MTQYTDWILTNQHLQLHNSVFFAQNCKHISSTNYYPRVVQSMIVCLSLRYTAEPHLVNIVSLNPQILTCARQYANFSHTFPGGVRTTFVISDNQFCNSDNL